jgi:hypothetical protein
MLNWKTLAVAVSAVCLFAEQSSSFPVKSYLAPSNVQSVTFKECHKVCSPGTGTKAVPCEMVMRCTTTKTTTRTNAPVLGSTGPTTPPKPVVNPMIAPKLGGSTGPTVPPKPINR